MTRVMELSNSSKSNQFSLRESRGFSNTSKNWLKAMHIQKNTRSSSIDEKVFLVFLIFPIVFPKSETASCLYRPPKKDTPNGLSDVLVYIISYCHILASLEWVPMCLCNSSLSLNDFSQQCSQSSKGSPNGSCNGIFL